MKYLLAILLCLSAPRALATIAFDSTSGHSGTAGGTANGTYTVTVSLQTAQTGIMVVQVHAASLSGNTVTPGSGGGTWTSLGCYSTSSTNVAACLFYNLSLTSASSVAVTTSGGTTVNEVRVAVGQYTGISSANGSNCADGQIVDTTGNLTCTVGSLLPGSWLIGALAAAVNPTLGVGSGTNNRVTNQTTTGTVVEADEGGSGLSIKLAYSSNGYGSCIACEFEASTAVPQMMMTGLGQ